MEVCSPRKNFDDEVLVHRIIAKAWCDNDDPKHKVQINHINAIRTDNRPENLEWCTVSYNIRDAMKRNPDMQVNARKALKEVVYKPILVYDAKTGTFVKEFPSAKEAGQWLQETKGAGKQVSAHISECLHGKRPTCFGYKYEFKDPSQTDRAVFQNSKKHKANLKEKRDKLVKPVYQYEYGGMLVKTYQNIFKVIEQNPEFVYGSLQKAVTGRDTKHRHHYAKYSWFYSEQTPEQIAEYNR